MCTYFCLCSLLLNVMGNDMGLVNRVRQGEDQIRNVQAEFTTSEPDTGRQFARFTWGYEQGREFYTSDDTWKGYEGMQPGSVSKTSFDGQRQYAFERTADSKRMKGGVYGLEVLNFTAYFTPMALLGYSLMQDSRGTLTDAISSAERISVYPEKERLDGHECTILEAADIRKGQYSFTIKAWIDEERGCRPLKLENYRNHDPNNPTKYLTERLDNIKLTNVDGIWFPSQGDRQFFRVDTVLPDGRSVLKMSPAELADVDEEMQQRFRGMTEDQVRKEAQGLFRFVAAPFDAKKRMEITDIRMNKGIPDDAFRITFPPGTRVYDGFAQVAYVVGAASLGQDSLGLSEAIEPNAASPQSKSESASFSAVSPHAAVAQNVASDSNAIIAPNGTIDSPMTRSTGSQLSKESLMTTKSGSDAREVRSDDAPHASESLSVGSIPGKRTRTFFLLAMGVLTVVAAICTVLWLRHKAIG